MKTISLRTFRDSVQSLTEPVEVVKREDGEFRTLGTWTPLNATEEFARHIIVATAPFGAPRPVPKPGPSKRGSK